MKGMQNFWIRKGLVILFLLVATSLLFPGCSSESKDDPTGGSGEATSGEAPNEDMDDITVEQQVLFDQNGIVVTLKSLDVDNIWGPSLLVLVENNGTQNATVQVKSAAINGVMMDTMFSSDVTPGKKSNEEITITSDFEVAGISIIKDIELSFHVFNTDNWETLFDTELLHVTTSADDSYQQVYDDSGFLALDQSGVKIVVKRVDSKDSFWGADVYVYLENNTNHNLTVQARDVSINGFMVDPAFSSDVLAGKKAYDSLTFFESDLIDNGIDSVDELELSFHVFYADSWETMFDSAPVLVKFE